MYDAPVGASWLAAYALGIAFTQPTTETALRELRRVAAPPGTVQRAAGMVRHRLVIDPDLQCRAAELLDALTVELSRSARSGSSEPSGPRLTPASRPVGGGRRRRPGDMADRQ